MGRPSDGLPRRATLTHSARPCQYSTAKKRGLNGGEERMEGGRVKKERDQGDRRNENRDATERMD